MSEDVVLAPVFWEWLYKQHTNKSCILYLFRTRTIKLLHRPDYGGSTHLWKTSETSVSFHDTTRRNVPEDSYILTRRRENLKSRLGNLHREVSYDQEKVYNYKWMTLGTFC
jgi:hypothetical protein